MPSGARFKIGASLSSDGGYDAAAGAVLALQLEASPALDVQSCTYSILTQSPGAPSATIASSGVASPPTAVVNLTLPSPLPHGGTWVVVCRTNGGTAVAGLDGKPDYSVNSFSRAVAVRSSSNLRKMWAGERFEYNTTDGWAAAFGEIVNEIDALAAGGVPPARQLLTTAPLTGGGDLSADRTLAISAASGGAAGTMSASDFTKLANAAATATASAIAQRDGNGGAAFGYIVLPAATPPGNPASGYGIYTDTGDGHLKARDSSGTVTQLVPAAGGGGGGAPMPSGFDFPGFQDVDATAVEHNGNLSTGYSFRVLKDALVGLTKLTFYTDGSGLSWTVTISRLADSATIATGTATSTGHKVTITVGAFTLAALTDYVIWIHQGSKYLSGSALFQPISSSVFAYGGVAYLQSLYASGNAIPTLGDANHFNMGFEP